jgi:hypothetical protein
MTVDMLAPWRRGYGAITQPALAHQSEMAPTEQRPLVDSGDGHQPATYDLQASELGRRPLTDEQRVLIVRDPQVLTVRRPCARPASWSASSSTRWRMG